MFRIQNIEHHEHAGEDDNTMRRAIYISSVLVAITFTGGQVASGQTIASGVKFGIDFSALPNAGQILDPIVQKASTESTSKVGVLGGGYVQFGFGERYSFQPELFLVMKGVKLTESANGGTFTASTAYLEFPLLARYTMPISLGSIFAMAGPTFGVKAHTSGHLDSSAQADFNIDNAIRTFDMGFALAGGMERGRYSVELRYTQGLTDAGTEVYPHADNIRNRVIAIIGGYKITK
ncbi:MAG TPA: porin family protein [Vicinamibacterales bacterium]|nr:porin family protein [Vicinamibacterales bacterium]